MDGISRREFARRASVSEGLIRQAIKANKLPVSEDGSLDPALVDTWRANGHADPMTLADATRMKEIAIAKLRQIEVDRLLEKTCEIDVAVMALAEILNAVRSQMLAVGAITAPLLAVTKNASECQAIVDDCIHKGMRDLNDALAVGKLRDRILRQLQ